MQQDERQRLATIGDLAIRAGVSPTLLRRLEARGAIPTAERAGPGGMRFWTGDSADEVVRLVNERRAARTGVAA